MKYINLHKQCKKPKGRMTSKDTRIPYCNCEKSNSDKGGVPLLECVSKWDDR